ncbi:exported serine/threonine protein kinase, putative [Plasmodium relictum]|uniref:Exported serine/threonine protein kinase, putative n=1 Tax=Plasmodium relictum TaxID=85471 RepID=A0A1J1H1H5_PLARL|nr:exported serine/threonine protein kinase, putative [Plasmodium relictum]CRG98629.1 exported serine/threonine protein kinase, putative [Plasmodium relictum]
MDKDLSNKLKMQNSNISCSNFNGIDFLETRNDLYLNNSDVENYDKTKNNNIKFTNTDNSKWNYDNQTLRQNHDINISNEINSNNINICDLNNNIINYQKKINNYNSLRQNNIAYLDSNTLNSNNIFNFNKVYNENNPLVIKSNTTDNNLQKMNSQYFNVMKYSDYYNSNNCIYNTNILNTSISENQKNYSNNSSPYKNDYLKFNLSSVNVINSNLNFSNTSNSSNANSNVFNSNRTTPSINVMNYNPINSCNIKYNSNMFDFTSTGNVNSLKVKDFNFSELNPINFQESDLSNYSNVNLKNINFLNTPVSYNIISNNIDSNSYISSNNSKCLNSNFLKIHAINYNDSNIIKEKSNQLIFSESSVFCNDKEKVLNEENLNIEDEKKEKRKRKEKDIEEKDKEKKTKIERNEKYEEEKTKRKKVHLINNNFNIQKKKHKNEIILKNIEDKNGNPKKKNYDEDEDKDEDEDNNDYIKEISDINKKKYLKKEKENNMIKKNKNKRDLTNDNKTLNIKVKNFDSFNESHQNIREGMKISSTVGNEKHIVVSRRNSNVLRKIINFENTVIDTRNENLPSKRQINIKHLKDVNIANIVRRDTIKDRLRSSAKKTDLEKNEKNKSKFINEDINNKSLSKYDFLVNKNIMFKNVSIGNKKVKSNMEASHLEKHYNILEEKNNDINEKKRKFKDSSEIKDNIKDEKIELLSKSEKKIKKNKYYEKLHDTKVMNNINNETVYEKECSGKSNKYNERKKDEKENFKNIEEKKKSKIKKKNNTDYINNKENAANVIKDCEHIKEKVIVDEKYEREGKIYNIRKENKNFDNIEEKRKNGKMKNKQNSEKTAKEKSEFDKLEENYNEKIKEKEELNNITFEKKKKKLKIKNFNKGNYIDMKVKDNESLNKIIGENKENKYKNNENKIMYKEETYINKENYAMMKENECTNTENKIIYEIHEFKDNENKVMVEKNEYENKESNKIIEDNEYKNNENEIIIKKNEKITKESETLIKENKNKNNENENYCSDLNDMYDTKEEILEKEELKINESNNKYHTEKFFNNGDNKCDLNNSLNIRKNKCNLNNPKYVTNSLNGENNMNSNLNKINDIKRKVFVEKEKGMNDKDNYQITKSVIDENINSNLFCNYDKKNSIKDLTRDLYSSTDGNNDIINNKKKKFWSNLGSISYIDNFVGKGSYGSVRKVLYNIDLNREHLKFYIDKINSREFINLFLESNSIKVNSEFNKDERNSLHDKKDIKEIFKNSTKHVNDKKRDLSNFENVLLASKKVDNCLCCYNKRYFELAIKEIDVSRKGNEFQFLREQELLCHFNSNVIKPLSTKIGNLKEKQNYEILMHCANGDLRKLLQNLIYHRKKEFEKRKKVNKILKLMHIIFGRKYKCYRNENDNTCIGLCYEKLKKIKMKLNNSIVEIKYPKFDHIYDNIKVYNCGLTESECKFLFFQIVNGISFIQTCYQSNIIRVTDIKLQNILVYTDVYNLYNPMRWHLCISDFGCSAMEYATFYLENSKNYLNVYKTLLNQWKYQFKNQLSSYFQGTVYTMAPEGLCYDHKGNFRQSKYNKLIYFYEQNFGNIESRFQELQKPLVSIKNSVNNFNILNINSSSNFHFLNDDRDEKLNNNNNNNNKEEKSILDNKDSSKKINLLSNVMNIKNKNSEQVNSNEKNNLNEKSSNNNNNNNNNSTEYLPFDVRCDSWSLGIILADLGKCGISSYEYMISEKSNEDSNNTIGKGKNINLNNIILNDLNISDDDEIFYLKYIMNYYDIAILEWDNKEIENEKIKKDINKNEKRANEKENVNINNLNNNYINKQKEKIIDNNIISKNYSIGEEIKGVVENELLNKDFPNDENKKNRGTELLNINDTNKERENKSTLKDISDKDKTNGDNNLENLELFTKHYKLFMLKYKEYLKNDKVVTIKSEFIKYYKMNKNIMNESNIDKTLLLLFLIINNNISYNYNYEVQSFLKIELTIKNLGSGIFKFRSKKEKEKYLQEFKMNIQKEYMNGNKEYWHSRLTNKYLAVILKDICHDNFTNRKKNIKKCFNKFEFPLNYSDDYWNLLTDLLNYVPYERLLACEIIGHDFFSASNEKIKNIKFENTNEYNELFDKKEFCDIILRNYLQEKKEKRYLYKLLHEESEIDIDNSDNRKYQLKHIDKIREGNPLTQLDNHSNKRKKENELKTNKFMSNEIHNNYTNNFISFLYDTIIGNMKNKCDFCDNMSDCLDYKNILRKIENLENNILNITFNNRNIINEKHKKNKILYPSNICNNIYYFLNEYSIYNEFKKLDIFMNIHLPFEHLCLPICDEKTVKNKNLINFFFKPIYYYSFPYKIIHAWYIGPLHIYLNHPNIPDYIKLICLRESNILRRKEIIFWCSEDIILKNILKIKKLLSCSNDFLCTPYISHIIGKQLIIRKQYLLKLFKKKIV